MKRPGLITALLLGILTTAGAESYALEAFLPASLETRFIWRTDRLPDGVEAGEAAFALDREGRPHLGFRNILIALGHRDGVAAQAYRVPGVQTIDAFAWMRDGALLVISGETLGVRTEAGLEVILRLPSRGMKIEPASGNLTYLYGGDTPRQRQSIYVYRKGGQLLHLLKAPSAIGAVAGDGEITFFAIARSIYLQIPGEALRFVYEAEEAVTSLALAPPWGLFYGTERAFGYISESGKGYAFVRGIGGTLRVHGEDIYLFVAEEGVMKGSPVSSFEQLAQSLMAGLPGQARPPAEPLEIDLGPAVSEADSPAAAEVVFWDSIQDSDDPAYYRAYLDSFPSGSFVALARTRIAAIEAARADETVAAGERQGVKQRLMEIEELLELELITPGEFAEKRRQILDDL